MTTIANDGSIVAVERVITVPYAWKGQVKKKRVVAQVYGRWAAHPSVAVFADSGGDAPEGLFGWSVTHIASGRAALGEIPPVEAKKVAAALEAAEIDPPADATEMTIFQANMIIAAINKTLGRVEVEPLREGDKRWTSRR